MLGAVASLGVVPLAMGQTATASFYAGPAGRDMRRAKAKEYSETFHKLFWAIPNLSPAQAEFVRNEYQGAFSASEGKYSARLLRLMDGREYNIREAKPWALNIAAHANAIPDVIDEKWEVFHWSKVAAFLTDRTGAQRVYRLKELGALEIKDLPVGKDGSASLELFIANLVLMGNTILNNVVSPYLEGKLPD